MSFQLHKDREHPPLSRRAVLLGAVGLAGLSVLGGRLYYLQFMRNQQLKMLAEDNRIKLQIVPPVRGKILDRNGASLAENESVFRVFLDVDKNPDAEESLKRLQQWLSLSERELAKIKKSLKRRGASVLVKDRVPWDTVVQIEHHIPSLPGVDIEQGQQRVYPLAEQAAHVIGYVGGINEEEKKRFYRWPEAKIGRQGLERSLEESLRGDPGLRQLEVNVHGLPLRELAERPSIKGEDLTTSLHRELQAFAYDRLLKERSGSAVIMDARDGQLLAMASAPAFNSTVMSQGIGSEAWNALRESDAYPLLDKTIAGQYPPGSVFKMMTGLAGLRSAISNPQRRIYCPGHYYLGRQRFNCWRAGGHGSVNLASALERSCDTYFYTIANEMGMDALASTCRDFGLGAHSGVDIPGEKSGIVPDKKWKKKSYNQPWVPGDTVNASIGQGYVLTTPLQLARMTAALVNGGKLLRPRLLQEAQSQKLEIDPAHLAVIRAGMEAAVNGGRGTARGSRIWEADYAMGGKTGTAQVRRIEVRGQDQSTIPWNQRHHALFVGYAPMENPRYICSVVIEHGGGGSSTAAPIARELLLKTRELVG
jgi:penicillin-binding protein 2